MGGLLRIGSPRVRDRFCCGRLGYRQVFLSGVIDSGDSEIVSRLQVGGGYGFGLVDS